VNLPGEDEVIQPGADRAGRPAAVLFFFS